MQLNEILEKYTLEEIAKQTKIDKKSLENLFDLKFSDIRKAKALGFVSILEREYKVDLSKLKSEVLSYYKEHQAKESVVVGIPREMPKRKNPKMILSIVATFVVLASGFLFTQVDKNTLKNMIPLLDKQTIEEYLFEDDTLVTVIPPLEEKSSDTLKSYHNLVEIIPSDKLWIGIINTTTLKREYLIIDKAYTLDLSSSGWLVATSALGFTIINEKGRQSFDDEEEHYFKIDKKETQLLTQKEYLAQGGWNEW